RLVLIPDRDACELHCLNHHFLRDHYAVIAIAVQGVQALPWQRMPQPADTVPIDRYIVDTLMRDLVGHDRQPSAYLVYVFLWNETHGRKQATTPLALIAIAAGVVL